ncbi:MAG: hypothetical protein AAGH64_07495, partial [Planctomycetota bacterium]
MTPRTLHALLLLSACGTPALAQFNPGAGQWLKGDPTHLRVMTWNVGDNFFAFQQGKQANVESSWNAAVRVIAGLEPDVLLLQEAADDNGADTISQTETVLDLLRYGGPDPFVGGTVTSNLAALTSTPGYDLPFAYILNATDGFNRNIILSRYPIADINNDGVAAADDISVSSDLWQSGGDGGVRGFNWAEIDLPDETYAGDLVVGNSHFKAFGDCDSYTDRIEAAENISYFIEYYWNGNQGPTTDPRNRINSPSSGDVLDANTPVIWGGDWNNNPFFFGNGSCSTSMNPVEIMLEGGGGSGDGADRDGSNARRDFATVPGTGDSSTQSSSKLDYLAWQDSIAIAVEEFIFRTNTPFPLPPAVANGPRPFQTSTNASDHRPVIVDFVLPLQAASGPPVLSSFSPDPASASFNDTIDFTVNAFDPDGSIVGDVEFYDDTNNDGSFDAGDVLIGAVTPSNPGAASLISFSIAPSGFLTPAEFNALVGSTKTVFARATDDAGLSSVADAVFTPVFESPAIDLFTASPLTVDYVTPTQVTVEASDPDGQVASIEVLFDTNDNNVLDAGDIVVASLVPNPQSGAATLSEPFVVSDAIEPAAYTARLGTGNRLFARVTDDNGLTSDTAISLTFVNTPPVITDALATPNPAGVDTLVTITATITDPDGSINNVIFLLDDGDGVPEAGQDQVLGTLFAPPFQAFWFTSGIAPGDQREVLIQAFDDQVVESVASVTVTIASPCDADFDGDGDVDLGDFGIFGGAFGATAGSPNYNPDADFDGDGDVDLG